MKHFLNISWVLFLFFLLCNCKEDNQPIEVPQPKGAVLSPDVGGPAEPNQVWVDLDLQTMTTTQRDLWDLGFYNGDEFRVILNNSIMMAAGKVNSTNIDEVSEADVALLKPVVAVGTFSPDNVQYVDDIKGDYLKRTAIDPISMQEEDNKVYLINMGYRLYSGSYTSGTVYSSGEPRGWKKIRVLRTSKNGYKIQYADISEKTHKEFIITKQPEYLFTFFTFSENKTVKIQPEKNNWDLCFTIFTNENAGFGTYIFSDFVTSNVMNKTGVYQAAVSESGSYDSFTKEKVNYSKFIYDDQRVIGSTWRQTYNGPTVYTDRFYVIKDHLGTLYKLRFLKMTDNNNYRGYPQFEYDILY